MNESVYIAANNDDFTFAEFNTVSEIPPLPPEEMNSAPPASSTDNAILLGCAILFGLFLIAAAVAVVLRMKKNAEYEAESERYSEEDFKALRSAASIAEEERIEEDNKARENQKKALGQKVKKTKPEKEKQSKQKPVKPIESKLKLSTPKTLGKCLRVFLDRTKDI